MSQEFISSQTVRKNYYPPVNNLESDYFRFLDRARHCVLASFVVVDLLIKLVAFHEEKLVEKFGSDVLLLVEHHVEFVHIRDLTSLGSGSLNIVMTCGLLVIQGMIVLMSVMECEDLALWRFIYPKPSFYPCVFCGRDPCPCILLCITIRRYF